MKETDTASAIIDSEFGDSNAGKTKVKDCFWWPNLLAKVNKLCEESARIGYRNCQDIHKDKILTPDIETCIHKETCKYYEGK